ncbi:MAG: CRTAC1 family protein [Planctomycetes bacterium]|nr:CRTAC1 family protein [Planctomycetota bacterium]
MIRRALSLLLFASACGTQEEPTTKSRANAAAGSAPTPPAEFVAFHERRAAAGIEFEHRAGSTSRKLLLESMGGGLTVLDFDGDGAPDVYCVDSGALPERNEVQAPGGNRLFKNLGDGRFRDVSNGSGAQGRGYMMGAIAGDYDNDGDQDLYVTACGSNTLLRNDGAGKFTDVTRAAGCDDPRWSTGAAFLDYDRDGDLDLFVQNYLVYDIAKQRPYFDGQVQVSPPPDLFDPESNALFRNRGDGTFEDVSEASGIGAHRAKGLGVVTGDFDDDGDVDVFCANDVSPNFLFANRGDGTFKEVGALSGTAYSAEGREESGMGTDAADFDNDGLADIVVTNFSAEPNSLYRNEGKLSFTETSSRSGTWESSMPRLGFGVRLADLDNDGARDLVVANGHIYDNAERVLSGTTYRQPPLLYRGLGNGRFNEVSAAQPAEFREPRVARALATADLDGDGDLELLLGILDGAPLVFDNLGGNRNAWVSVRCVGTGRDSTALGARVVIECGGKRQFSEVRSGASYLSQSDLRQFFGLGASERIERIVVRWPDGREEEARDLPARAHYVFEEGRGIRR